MMRHRHIRSFGLRGLLKATSLLLCVLLAGACANDTDLGDVDSDMPICFTVENEKTRATDDEFTDFTGADFGVTAYWYPNGTITDEEPLPVMDNLKINYANGVATIDSNDKYYWVKGGWHFAAYSPWVADQSTAPMEVTTPTVMYGGYTYSGTVDGETDYMFADEQCGYFNVEEGTNRLQEFSGVVPMLFRHALTKVTFSVKLSDADGGANNLKFKNISLSNIHNKGSISFTHNGLSAEGALNPTNVNARNLWTTKDASGAITEDTWSVDGQKTEYAVASNIVVTDEAEHPLENILYLMPQILNEGEGAQMLNVSYDLKLGENAAKEYNISVPLYSAAIPKWKSNSHVHYTLTVNLPGGTADLNVDVQPWDYVETTIEFSNTVGMSDEDANNDGVADDILHWTEGTYQSINTTDNRVIVKPDITQHAQFTFRIGSPQGSTWYAMLRSKRGNPSAFRLAAVENASITDGVALGAVGDRVTLEVVANDANPTETNEAELIFIVICNGQILSANIVAPNAKNFTIIQNINI